jgi:hypothetical protein
MALTPEEQKRLEELEGIEKSEKKGAFSATSPSLDVSKIPESEEADYSKSATDALAGLAQGATLGFGDEALAALQATLAKPENVSWYEEYRRKQKENEEAYKEMKERSPWLTGAGELTGGFLMPGGAFLKGAGVAAKEAGLAAKAAGATEKAIRAAEGLSKVKSSAKAGALIGGLAGLGASEKNIEDPSALIKEGVTGAAVGGAFGAAGEKSGQWLKEFVEESPKIQRALRVLDLERKGTNLTTEEGQQEILKRLKDASKDTAKELEDVFNFQKDQLRQVFEEHGKEIPKNEGSAQLIDKVKNIFEKQTKEFDPVTLTVKTSKPTFVDEEAKTAIEKIIGSEKLKKIQEGSATLGDLNEARANILENAKKYIKELGTEGKNQIFGINRGADKEKIPGIIDFLNKSIDDHNPEIATLRDLIKTSAMPTEMLLTKTDDVAAVHKRISDYTDEQLKDALNKTLNKTIEDMANLGMTGAKTRGRAGEFFKEMKDSEAKLADYAKQKGIERTSVFTPEKREQTLKDVARDISALKSQIGERPISSDEESKSLLKAITPVGLIEGGLSQVAGKLGRIESNLGQPVSKVLKAGKATTAQLQEWSNLLKNSSNPVAKKLGENAASAFESGDAASKAAMLNSIMQNPEARKLVMDRGE